MTPLPCPALFLLRRWDSGWCSAVGLAGAVGAQPRAPAGGAQPRAPAGGARHPRPEAGGRPAGALPFLETGKMKKSRVCAWYRPGFIQLFILFLQEGVPCAFAVDGDAVMQQQLGCYAVPRKQAAVKAAVVDHPVAAAGAALLEQGGITAV